VLPKPEKAIKFRKDQFRPRPYAISTSDPAVTPSDPVHALTVYFDLDSSVIKAGEAEKLLRFIKHVPKTSEIRITGYTCPLGTDAYNQKLAMERAQAVARVFKNHGLQVRSITGRSGCCFISPTDPSKNRRAEVQVRSRGRAKHMRGGE
jgi:outer membrane protein OmpA-like peptidoglycan-associated protein